MSISSQVPARRTQPWPKMSETESFQNFWNEIVPIMMEIKSNRTPSDKTILEKAGTEIVERFLGGLIEEYVRDDRPRLPFLPITFFYDVSGAQAQLTERLTEKNKGKPPRKDGLLPPEPPLPGLDDKLPKDMSGDKEILHIHRSDNTVSTIWKLKDDGPKGPIYYNFPCGPKLCGTRGGKTCGHGLLTSENMAPPGWDPVTGFNGIYSPFEGDSAENSTELDPAVPEHLEQMNDAMELDK